MRTNKRVGAIVIKDYHLLLIHRFKNGSEYWVLPGGAVETGESLIEALTREVKEETSLDLLSYDFIGFCEPSEGDEHQHYFYKCKLADGTPEISGPEKENSTIDNTYSFEWILLKDLPTLTLYPPSVRSFLK